MIEQANGFMEEKASFIQKQIRKEKSTDLSGLIDLLPEFLVGKKESPVERISGEVVSSMDLEPIEKTLLRGSLYFRISRLLALYHNRKSESLFSFSDFCRVRSDSDIIAESQKKEPIINSVIDRYVRFAQKQLVVFDGNSVRCWLEQARDSGTLMGTYFYDKDKDPINLASVVKEQDCKILQARQLVSPEVRELINAKFLQRQQNIQAATQP